MNKLAALARLTRIEHSLMLVIAVLAAELIAGGLPGAATLALSLITPIFISAGSFAVNDYYDVEADRLNKRTDRPIVGGAISRNGALAVFAACMLIGVGASAFINAAAFVIAVVFAALAFLYSYRLKDILLVGNAYIALSMVIPFIFGSYVVSSYLPINIALICFVTFLSGMAREIHGMVRDQAGDAKGRRSRNLVYHIGAMRSSMIAAVLYIEAVAISILMFFYLPPFAHNAVYIAPILVVDAVILYISVAYLRKRSKGMFKTTRDLSLGAMALALLVYLVVPLAYIMI